MNKFTWYITLPNGNSNLSIDTPKFKQIFFDNYQQIIKEYSANNGFFTKLAYEDSQGELHVLAENEAIFLITNCYELFFEFPADEFEITGEKTSTKFSKESCLSVEMAISKLTSDEGSARREYFFEKIKVLSVSETEFFSKFYYAVKWFSLFHIGITQNTESNADWKFSFEKSFMGQSDFIEKGLKDKGFWHVWMDSVPEWFIDARKWTEYDGEVLKVRTFPDWDKYVQE